MDKFGLLSRIQNLYTEQNVNITNYLKELSDSKENTLEDILISYDFQAGTYTKAYTENPDKKKQHLKNLIDVLNNDMESCESIIEVGVGEATSLGEVLNSINYKPTKVLGLDLSWSRIKYANIHLNNIGITDNMPLLFTGDLFNVPLADNSIELVYTVHSLEPNGGKEREAIEELYRISSKYVVLVEPCYENANKEAKHRMEKLGYVKGLTQCIKELGYKIILNKALENDMNPLNPANIIVIEKTKNTKKSDFDLCCPLTKTKLIMENGCYYSKESLLAYPIIGGVPCLLGSNAIVATKMLEE